MTHALRCAWLLAVLAAVPVRASAGFLGFDADHATCQYYFLPKKSAWSKPGGDWFDKEGRAFGLLPFASETVPVRPKRQLIRWNITTLASRWQTGEGAVGAVYLRVLDGGSSGVVNFDSLESADPSARPMVDVEWDDGQAVRIAPSSDTYFACPTYSPLGQRLVLKVSPDESALLVFPFAARPGHQVRSAVLVLATDKQYSRTSDIGVFGLLLPSGVVSSIETSAAKAHASPTTFVADERAATPPRARAQVADTQIRDPDADWLRRSHAPGVVIAVGFDDIRDWAKYSWDRSDCNPAYQLDVDGRKSGCRSNAWDPNAHASGKGSVRFDILSQSTQGGAGNIVIPFGDYATSQFGANSELWVSWRQRMDTRFIEGYKAHGGGYANAKQIIIAQGDVPAGNGARVIPGKACSEAELVIVGSSPGSGPTYPIGYIECGRYLAFEQLLRPGQYAGEARGSTVITRQNMRADALGRSDCIAFPTNRDQSGCFVYRPDEWITYMVHLKIGPDGGAVSSVSGKAQPGYIDSSYEFYASYQGQDFQLLHRQTSVVIPKGQYYIGGDPSHASSYRPGWGPGDAYPQARYGKLWLLPYMTDKDPGEVSANASTWYDEVIVSRCRIAAPGFPIPMECASADSVPSPLADAATPPVPPRGGGQPAPPAPSLTPATGLPAPSQIPAPGPTVPTVAAVAIGDTRMIAGLKSLKPGHWLEIPDSEMVRVQVDACKSPAIQRAYDRIGNGVIGCNPDSVMAYSGGAYDSRSHRLLVWGGGHAGYAGNEIYAFDMMVGQWQRLTEPTPPELSEYFDRATKHYFTVSPPWRDPDYPPTPVSVHSYDQLDYLPEQNMLFAAGGATFSGSGFATSGTWLFDLSKHDASGWIQAQPMPGKPYGLYEYNMATDYDPVSRNVIMRGYSKAATFDPVNRTWTITNESLPSRRLGTVGAIDPKRRRFLVLGGGTAELYSVGESGVLGPPQKLDASGGAAIEACYGPGLDYDSAADRLVAWCGKGDAYSLDLEQRVWTRHPVNGDTVPGDPAETPGVRGTWGRFRYMPEYDAFIVVNGNRQNVFLYRLGR